MFDWYESEAKQRQRERMAEAEQTRMAKIAGVKRQAGGTASSRALIWLGHRLVESGKRLQGDDI